MHICASARIFIAHEMWLIMLDQYTVYCYLSSAIAVVTRFLLLLKVQFQHPHQAMAAQSDLDKKQLAGTALNNVLGVARSVKTASQVKVATELRLAATQVSFHFLSFWRHVWSVFDRGVCGNSRTSTSVHSAGLFASGFCVACRSFPRLRICSTSTRPSISAADGGSLAPWHWRWRREAELVLQKSFRSPSEVLQELHESNDAFRTRCSW